MTCATLPSAAKPPVPAASTRALDRLSVRRTLPRAAGFYLQASVSLSFLAGSSGPTPLYAVYRSEWGFSPTMLTLVFGVYAIAVLTSLLVAGRLSDHLGRRPVLVASAAVQVLAMLLFATADGVGDLLAARIVQGLAVGTALAAAGAALLDLDVTRGAVANAVAPMAGTAFGGVAAGLVVQYGPAPTHLVYALFAAVFALQAVGLAFVHETVAPHDGALASLRPHVGVPAAARSALLRAAPAMVATWALAGFYASLGPTLLRELSGSSACLLGGVALFVLAGSGALATLALRRRAPANLLRIGTTALLVGMPLALVGIEMRSVALFLAATSVAGIGFGTGFQGALRSVMTTAAPAERTRVLSVVFVISYLAMGLPAIAAGWALAHTGDVVAIARVFAAAVAVLAALALAATRRRR